MRTLIKKELTLELKHQANSAQHYIVPGAKLVQLLLKQGHKRVLCTINDNHRLHSAIQHRKNGEYYIHIGSSTLKQLGLRVGEHLKVKIEPDQTPSQFEMPEELQAVLDTDEKAKEVFGALSSGAQRSLMYLVLMLKTGSKRIERALLIAEKLKSGVTQARLILKIK